MPNAGEHPLSPTTENILLNGGVSARVVYSEEDLPALMSGERHVFLMLSDQIGSNTFVIDHQTGELVEYATYPAYGSTESNYRAERWGSFRESFKLTGKEEDVEVGRILRGAIPVVRTRTLDERRSGDRSRASRRRQPLLTSAAER